MLDTHQTGTRWTGLYTAATYLAWLMLAIIPLQIVIFIMSPPPSSVVGFYELYQQDWLLGLLSLDFLYIINNVIMVIIYAALYINLTPKSPQTSFVALVLGLVGLSAYFASNPAFEFLSLSGKYVTASPAQAGGLVAAGEALLAGYTGTAFDVYYVVNAIVLLLFAVAILKNDQYPRQAGWWGIAAGILMVVPSSAGMVGMVFSLLSLVPWIVFLAMVSMRFNQLRR